MICKSRVTEGGPPTPYLSRTGGSIRFLRNYELFPVTGEAEVQLRKLRFTSFSFSSDRLTTRINYLSRCVHLFLPQIIPPGFETGSSLSREESFVWNILLSFLFTGFFKDLFANSKRVFHEMFKKTYGTLYEQNAYVFTDLFKELENYYAKGTVSHELMSKNLELSSLSRTNAFTFLIDSRTKLFLYRC